VVLVSLALVGLGGCGCCDEDDDWGDIVIDNLTDTTVPELVLTFRVAPIGEPWSGNLLNDPLEPGFQDYTGSWYEDLYDGNATMELGDIVEWFDIFVGDEQTTVFEVY
jgi:hypothetical protein